MRLLDVGCGSGTTLRLLGGGVGLDRDLSLLRTARQDQDSDQSQSFFVRADANRLPFADGSFDCILIRLVLRHNRQPLRILEESTRVSRDLVCALDADDLAWVLEPPPA